MNTILQNILAFSVLALALLYLVKTYIWWPKKKAKKACGDNGDCGCH